MEVNKIVRLLFISMLRRSHQSKRRKRPGMIDREN